MQHCKGTVKDAGIRNVKMTTLVSCVGGSADMGRHIVEYADSEQVQWGLGWAGVASEPAWAC